MSYAHSALGGLLFQSWRTKSDATEIRLSLLTKGRLNFDLFAQGSASKLTMVETQQNCTLN